ncbi:MAG: S9 family peptidase, partial [Chloroflexi bacterium]|nr:S9 family peptidase [Chloroflexota bacterium]
MTFPISRYLNIRAAYHPSFSTNGRFLSFISNITGTPQAWQVDCNQLQHNIPWPDQLTFAADRVMSARYTPDDQLIYTHDVGGNENAQIFLLNPTTGAETCLSTGHEAALHSLGGDSPDGRFFLFTANRRHRGQFDLYRQPYAGGDAEMLWQHDEPGYPRSLTYAPTGDK